MKVVTVRTHNVRGELDEQDGDTAKWQGHADRDVDEVRGQLWNVLCQSVGNGFLQVVENESTYMAEGVQIKLLTGSLVTVSPATWMPFKPHPHPQGLQGTLSARPKTKYTQRHLVLKCVKKTNCGLNDLLWRPLMEAAKIATFSHQKTK